jgi:hypothetical protein
MEATNALNNLVRSGPGAKDADLGRHGGALASTQGIFGKDRVIPYAASNARVGELQQYRADAA